MRRKRAIVFTAAGAAVLVAVAVALVVRSGSDGDTTAVVDQPVITAEPPAEDSDLPAPVTSAPQAQSSSAPAPAAEDLVAPLEGTTRMAVDPEGGLTLVHWDGDASSIQLVRCSDPSCDSPGEVITLGPGTTFQVEGEDHGPVAESFAFAPDGTPVVVMRHGDGETYTVYACADPGCDSVSSSPFNERQFAGARGIGGPRLAVGGDGTPRVAYFDRDRESLMLAVCEDPACSPEKRSVVSIDEDVFIPGEVSLHVLPDGRTYFGYETSADGISYTATVATCTDDSCSTGPTIREFENAVAPRMTFGDGQDFSVWYRSGPFMIFEEEINPEEVLGAWDLMVADCDESGCREPNRVEAGWRALFAWASPEDLIMLQAPEQVFIAHATWSTEACDVIVEIAAVDAADMAIGPALETFPTPSFTGAVTGDGQAIVVYQRGDELVALELGADATGGAGATASPSACQHP